MTRLPKNYRRRRAPSVADLLRIASAQLELALRQSETQVENLATSIARIGTLAAATAKIATENDEDLRRHSHEALIAMQFHDELKQRVEHVRDLLSELCALIAGQSMNDTSWRQLLDAMCERYSLEDERILCSSIITETDGAMMAKKIDHSPRGSVELF